MGIGMSFDQDNMILTIQNHAWKNTTLLGHNGLFLGSDRGLRDSQMCDSESFGMFVIDL